MALTRLDLTLPARVRPHSYPILIDTDGGAEERVADEVLARLAPGARVALLTDNTVAHLHLPRFEGALARRSVPLAAAVIPDGEASKSMAQAERVAGEWLRAGCDRRTLVLALGGGVVGDLAGFVAAIFLRGVSYAQLPTTLLAQVDSSVGGKTGVNLPAGKNLIGAFHQPLFVYADLTTLATLHGRDVAAGLAEVVKMGAIADESLLLHLESQAERASAGDRDVLAELVGRACRLKAAVVEKDERELDFDSGGRALLNFGHTLGHALESASAGQSALRHGEAVGLGMLAAARVGARVGTGDAALEGRLRLLLARLGLPTDLDHRLTDEVLGRVAVDKKRSGQKVAFVTIPKVGTAQLTHIDLDVGKLRELLLEKRR